MSKILLLVRTRVSENETYLDKLHYSGNENSKDNIEKALRECVQAYFATNEGQRAVEMTNNDFNWGDVVQDIPSAWLSKYGFKIESINPTECICVDQDEVLC